MSALAKLNLKTIQRVVNKDPITMRRDKLVAGIEEQQRVLDAALRGEAYTVATMRKTRNDAGDIVKEQGERQVRAWFFEQDNGYYVQCKYGSRALNINGKSNAVFVDKLADVAGVLEAFEKAADAGELDKAVVEATIKKK